MKTKTIKNPRKSILPTFKYFSLVLLFVLFSCSEDDGETSASRQEINDFLNPEVVSAMEDLGFNVYTGDNPPNVEATFLAELVMMETSVPGDAATSGTRFPNWKVRFSDQEGSYVFVEEFEDASGTSGEGYGALIVGEEVIGGESRFSVFVKQNLVDGNGHSYTSIRAISGDMFLSPSGEPLRILDFQLATMMLDNNGNPNGNLLPDNTGRLFNDENNNASRLE